MNYHRPPFPQPHLTALFQALCAGLIYGVQFVPLSMWLQANTPGNATGNLTAWVPQQCQPLFLDPQLMDSVKACAVLPTVLDVNTSSTNLALRFIFSQCVVVVVVCVWGGGARRRR